MAPLTDRKDVDMGEHVTITREEYDKLLEAYEDMQDLEAIQRHLENPQEGVPAAVFDRILDGESPLAVYREWRGYTQSSLARASGVNRVQIADLEAGRSNGSVATWKKLAETLNLTIDDLV